MKTQCIDKSQKKYKIVKGGEIISAQKEQELVKTGLFP